MIVRWLMLLSGGALLVSEAASQSTAAAKTRGTISIGSQRIEPLTAVSAQNWSPLYRTRGYGYLDARVTKNELRVDPPNHRADVMLELETGLRYRFGTTEIEQDVIDDVLVRLAKCCTPVPGDPILGYISLGRGITIHREDCPNAKALMRNPERFTPVEWEGTATTSSFRVQVAVDSFDRPRLLEDVARSFAEHGANIVSYGGVVEDGMARNWYTAEVGDVKELRSLLTVLRNLDGVFDAYRVTPS